LPWNIDNYYITDERVLWIEISIPLMEFLYTNIEDVKEAWMDTMRSAISAAPGLDVSWEMQPYETNAVVTIKIAKKGELKEFSAKEAEVLLDAVDALYDS
jgi:hypothetical protein